jgi:hypothetical protein
MDHVNFNSIAITLHLQQHDFLLRVYVLVLKTLYNIFCFVIVFRLRTFPSPSALAVQK